MAEDSQPQNGRQGSAGYDAQDITVLEGLEAVRKRPGMYIGSTGARGLHHLVQEIVDNSVDEALAGYCDSIEVTILEDGGVRCVDNGRGIPVDMHRTEGKSTVEHGRIGPCGAPLGGSGEKVADPPQFSRVLQEFHHPPRRGKRPSLCYSSVNQLLEPRPGGD